MLFSSSVSGRPSKRVSNFSRFQMSRWVCLPSTATVRFDVLEPEKRPVLASADSLEVRNVAQVDISSATDVTHRIMFDPGHGLEERLIREQFA